MNTIATQNAPISGLLSLVAGALEPATSGTPTPLAETSTPVLPTALGQLAGGWMTVKDDGQGWVLLQFAPHAGTSTGPTPIVETPDVESRPVPARPDFGARARRVHTALTEREREVLALVAAGRTNRQIGEELFMSEKTASVHVSRILAKLDVRTRGEAGAVAHKLGLDDT